MAIVNYVTLYGNDMQNVVDEKFVASSKSQAFVNDFYKFIGGQSIKLYTAATAPIGDYDRNTGFGTPSAPDLSETEYTMSQDKKFHAILDNMDMDETGDALDPASWLSRQIREVVVPMVDTYRFAQMVTNAGNTVAAASTKANIYSQVTDGTEVLDNAEVPEDGRVLGVSPKSYKLLKTSDEFISNKDTDSPLKISGLVGEVDDMPTVKIPSNRLPATVNFIIAHPIATVAPVKLASYKLNDDPDQYDGVLVSGRIYHDAFVLANKAEAIFVHTEV